MRTTSPGCRPDAGGEPRGVDVGRPEAHLPEDDDEREQNHQHDRCERGELHRRGRGLHFPALFTIIPVMYSMKKFVPGRRLVDASRCNRYR